MGGVTTSTRSIARWNWREEAWRSTTARRSPTCSSAGSTCGARSTIRRLPKRSVAWPSTRTTPRVIPASAHAGPGRPASGRHAVHRKAMRLDPHYPFLYIFWLGTRVPVAGALRRRQLPPINGPSAAVPTSFFAHLLLAAAYAQLGRMEEAKAEAAEALRMSPGFSVQRIAQRTPLKDPAVLARLVDGMRKAGLPE